TIAVDTQQFDHAHRDWVGAGRGAQCKGAALDTVVAGHLQHQISRGSVHPIEQDNVRAGLDILEGFTPSGLDLDRTDHLGLPRILRAVLALFPGRVDATDEIEPGVHLLRQIDRLFALPDAEVLASHAGFSRPPAFVVTRDGPSTGAK